MFISVQSSTAVTLDNDLNDLCPLKGLSTRIRI